MTDITVKAIRATLKRLDSAQTTVSRGMLAQALNIDGSDDKRRLRDALKQMVRRGELAQYDDGSYRFVVEASPPSTIEEQWERIYRAARTAKGSFDVDYISRVTVVRPYKVKSDLEKLTNMGFLKPVKLGEDICGYQGTQQLSDTPEIPPPPRLNKDVKAGLRTAREALAELSRIFITMEPGAAGSRKLIRRQLAILNDEFKGGVNDSEEN